ncbi:hypothetical protein PCANC_09203 [Puccinia coronata f. sp. avenae]|uniref:Uncharacterized protein n=1 Tax=Puccinia coronata f. sp. avenae TaxID=200324 RepID=A0A2N5SZB4_9BASI|nr:hypothetical protein PCANC_09203 [Puccinia coronata f. sp. avenae]
MSLSSRQGDPFKLSSSVSTRSSQSELVPPGEFKRQYQKKDLGSLQQGTPQGTLADQEALHASVRGGGLGSHDSAEGTSNRDSLHPREEDRQNEPACGNGGLESVHGPPPKGESTSGKQESSGSTQRQPSVNELFKLEKLHRFNSVKHRRPFNSLLQEFLNCKFNSAHSQLVKDPKIQEELGSAQVEACCCFSVSIPTLIFALSNRVVGQGLKYKKSSTTISFVCLLQ